MGMKQPIYRVGAVYEYTMLEHHYKGADRVLDYVTGTAHTKHGTVTVYAQGYTKNEKKASRFTFIHGGKSYVRADDRAFTDRGLSMIARRFARDVVAGRITK